MIGRVVSFAFGVVAYAAFFVTLLYMIGFVGGLVVPKTIDSGPVGPVGWAVLVNLLLIAAFAVQHTIMARPGFKSWWTRYVPAAVERSTFVLVTSGLLLLLYWQWRPLPAVVWRVDAPAARIVLQALCLAGFALVFYTSFLIDHFDLFGLRQVFLHLRSLPYRHAPFKIVSVYRLVRHPLMLGFLVAFWATPTMTAGHLLFAGAMTLYVCMGVRFEERDLARFLGDDYVRYRATTPMLLPGGRAKRHLPASAGRGSAD